MDSPFLDVLFFPCSSTTDWTHNKNTLCEYIRARTLARYDISRRCRVVSPRSPTATDHSFTRGRLHVVHRSSAIAGDAADPAARLPLHGTQDENGGGGGGGGGGGDGGGGGGGGGGGSGGDGSGGISIPRVTSGPSRMYARRYAAPRGTQRAQ